MLESTVAKPSFYIFRCERSQDHMKQDSRNDDVRGFKESVDLNKAYQKLRLTRLGK